jgi:hypothetical protein
MLSKSEWASFEESPAWREIIATVKARMALVNQDLLSPEACNNDEKRIKFQTEYLTCLWFINLPKYDTGGEDEETATALSDLPVTA